MTSERQTRFGNFTLDGARGCLVDVHGREAFLRPKSFLVLRTLAERLDELVSKDELIRRVWPDTFVSDESLTRCVSDIRKALGPAAAPHIRTVPRRGYMLRSEIAHHLREHRKLTPAAWRAPVAVAAIMLMVVAVWWSMTPRVTPAPALTAVTRTAPSGDTLDMTVRRAINLLDARDWTRRENNAAARELLEDVVAADPGHAEAWAGLGLTYWLEVRHLAWGGGRREMRQALEMVERSIALGGSPRAHRLLAEIRLLAPFEEMRSPLDALAAARAAVGLDPSDADSLAVLAQVLALTGQAPDAVEIIERARRLNPNYPPWYSRVAGVAYLLAGRPDDAAAEFQPLYGSGRFSQTRSWPGWLLAASLAHAGRRDEAAALVSAELARRPRTSVRTVATSLDEFADPDVMARVLDGLRLAGLPG